MRELFCKDCPIKGTPYCHRVNPAAKRYTRSEKVAIRKRIDETGEFNSSAIVPWVMLDYYGDL